ncbi:MAG: DUF1501 domain-containing protein [Planctomycetaceae bacterium]|nr:DUF1501 domain-containing protein [Planctomycetales bacterium]MCB9921894.1 DUF1501 domain-containing protein [Planctomycetaceae bacterium]
MSQQTVDRRDLLTWATGLGMSFALPALDLRAASTRGTERPRSLITLWLSGGPSQLETWDPHPGTKIGGPTQAISTSIPGVEIAHTFPLLAEQMHHLSVVRSLVSQEGDHDRATYLVKTGFRIDPTLRHPSVGAIVAHALPYEQLEIPPVISLGYDNRLSRGGFLGGRFDALRVREPGSSDGDMKAWLAQPRQQRRLTNLDVVSRAFARGRKAVVDRTMYAHNLDAALTMMTSDQLKAFQLDDESEATRAAYGDSNFGRGCLVARRLVEQGVRAIEVTLQNFDTHDQNFSRHAELAMTLDGAFTALLKDLHERDLLASTVVLCLGEFGRTPKINGADGRDHWPHGFSCLLGGGDLRSGALIGATDPTGREEEPEDAVPVPDLYATVLKGLGIDPTHQINTSIGRPIRYSDGTPIDRLLV